MDIDRLKPFFNDAIREKKSISTLWMEINNAFGQKQEIKNQTTPDILDDPSDPENICISCEG